MREDVRRSPRGRDRVNLDRITVDPRRMNGQPCIRGTRLTVRRVLEALAVYPDRAELFREYPELEDEDVSQALAYAAGSLEDQAIELAGVTFTGSFHADPRRQ